MYLPKSKQSKSEYVNLQIAMIDAIADGHITPIFVNTLALYWFSCIMIA